MELWAIAAFCATAGFCAKFSDEIAERQIPLAEAFAAAILWGMLAGVMASATPLSALFFAMAAGTILSGKIDHPLHFAGLISFAAIVLIFSLTSFNPWLFALFLVAALADELEFKSGILGLFSENRLFLPLAAAIGTIISRDISFLLAILAFDIFYKFADFACVHLFSPKRNPALSATRRSAGFPSRAARRRKH